MMGLMPRSRSPRLPSNPQPWCLKQTAVSYGVGAAYVLAGCSPLVYLKRFAATTARPTALNLSRPAVVNSRWDPSWTTKGDASAIAAHTTTATTTRIPNNAMLAISQVKLHVKPYASVVNRQLSVHRRRRVVAVGWWVNTTIDGTNYCSQKIDNRISDEISMSVGEGRPSAVRRGRSRSV
ncbi:hypothetical protein AC1031_010699 [Aphanomyces cochlioides]|nr:hypothetical protein AC1031_010699 [Aphanomyces cochlioides]